MAKYGSNSIVVEIDVTEGGALTDISQYVTDLDGVEVEAILMESHSFGDAWFEHLATGLRRMNPVTVGGFFDDVASGPNAIFIGVQDSPADASRTFKVTWGGTKTTTVEVWIQKYTRRPVRNELTRYEAVLQPTGSVTEV